jgi:hypothetical protein
MRLTWKLSGKAILPLIVLGVIAFAAWSWISRPRLPEPFTELVQAWDQGSPWSRRLAQLVRPRTPGQTGFRGWLWKRAMQSEWARWDHRSKSSEALLRLGTNAWPAVPGLIALLNQDNPYTRMELLSLLAALEADQHPDFEKLLRKRVKPGKLIEAASRFVIPPWPADSFPRSSVSTGALAEADLRFVMRCLEALGPAAAPITPFSITTMSDKANEPAFRAQLIQLAGRIGPKARQTIPHLQAFLQDEEEWPVVRAAALRALHSIQGEPVLPLAQAALRDPSVQVRVQAARIVMQSTGSSAEARKALRAGLAHKLPSIRLASVQAVSEIPAAVVDCFTELTSLLEDENEDVRRAARAALQAHAPDWPHRINLHPVDAGLRSD